MQIVADTGVCIRDRPRYVSGREEIKTVKCLICLLPPPSSPSREVLNVSIFMNKWDSVVTRREKRIFVRSELRFAGFARETKIMVILALAGWRRFSVNFGCDVTDRSGSKSKSKSQMVNRGVVLAARHPPPRRPLSPHHSASSRYRNRIPVCFSQIFARDRAFGREDSN